MKDGTRTFSRKLWELEPENYSGLKRRGVKYIQIMALVVKDFWDDQCLMRASALSFTTMLSLVPFLALAFSVLKGLGVQNKLEPLIVSELTAGSEEVVQNIITYINNTNMTSVGAIGLLALIVTVVSLLSTIEEAFNAIWGIEGTRSLYRKFSDYLSVMLSGPLLLVAATSITTSLQSQTLVRWLLNVAYFGDLLLFLFQLAPFFIVSLALVFLYVFIPNTTVRLKSALVGGILAGILWELVQWTYIHFQVGVAKYNAIYGTFAVLPIFMVWIYISWLIVLLGGEIVYAHQNIRTFRREVRTPSLSHRLKEHLTLAMLQKIARSFCTGETRWSAAALAEDLDSPVRIVREVLVELARNGYLVETVADPPTYQPAQALDQILVADVLSSLRSTGGTFQSEGMLSRNEQLRLLIERLDSDFKQALNGMTLRELASMDR